MQQKALTSRLDDLQFHALFNMSSVAVMSLIPHRGFQLSPQKFLASNFEPNQFSNGGLAYIHRDDHNVPIAHIPFWIP